MQGMLCLYAPSTTAFDSWKATDNRTDLASRSVKFSPGAYICSDSSKTPLSTFPTIPIQHIEPQKDAFQITFARALPNTVAYAYLCKARSIAFARSDSLSTRRWVKVKVTHPFENKDLSPRLTKRAPREKLLSKCQQKSESCAWWCSIVSCAQL